MVGWRRLEVRRRNANITRTLRDDCGIFWRLRDELRDEMFLLPDIGRNSDSIGDFLGQAESLK